jgi:outer membrane protein OmpA-like peptidoglycan-associated protein
VVGYRDEECEATIPAEPEAEAKSDATIEKATGTEHATPDIVVPLECKLELLPKVATIAGVVRDADTTAFVQGASVTIVDPRSRTLTLASDDRGAFRFENVPAGTSKITLRADGYLQATARVDLEARKDVSAQLTLNRKPTQPNVVVTAKELRLREQVHFLYDSAEILPDSMALIEEIASVLRERSEIAEVEIQGHTDDSGTPAYNLDLSGRRADAVRDALIDNGVESSRLVARGYGQESPVVPNTSDRNKARNRRVQIMILRK